MNWFKRIFIGIISLYLIALGLDLFISKLFLNSNLFEGEFEVWNDIENQNIDEDLVVYGSSRSFVHVNPKIIDNELNINSYNLGYNAQKIKFQKYRHNVYLRNNSPKNVIINLDINTLINVGVYKPEQYIPLLFFNKELFYLIKESINENYEIRYREVYIPLIRYRHYDNFFEEIVNLIKNDKKLYRYKGFLGYNREWKDINEKENIIEISDERLLDLKEIIEDLKNVNANVILINSPEYITQIHSQKNRKEIIDLYKDLAEKYKIPFIDYSSDSINYRKELFYNPNHLNAKGADIFTEKLANDIKPYLKK